jgi:hypothetical protein
VGKNKGPDPELGAGRADLEVASGGGRLELRPRGSLSRRSLQAEPPPSGNHLPVTTGLPLREECWNRLPPTVAARLVELAGEQIEWWARAQRSRPARGWQHNVDDRPSAVLIGATGAVFAEPRINSQHQPVYTIDGHVLDPGSHRRTEVIYRPTQATVDEDSRPTGIRVPVLREEPVPGLDPEALELLSNLPVRAQRLLTAPFDAQHPVRSRQWHYEGSANQFDVFAVVLIGADHLTLAHGSRVTPVGHTEQTSHWSLVCRRAKVLGQIHE